MKRFSSFDGVEIAYQEWAPEAGSDALPPVVLHHGFVADANLNWVRPGIVAALVSAGRHVVALDARGHGASGKPHDPAFYGEGKMVKDVRQLFDLIGAEQMDLVGYSMGAVVSLLTASQDSRVRRLVVGGVGAGIAERGGVDSRVVRREAIIAALRAPEPGRIADPVAARFRALADIAGADREALAAHASAAFAGGVPLDQITAPTLVIAGTEDQLAARPEALSAAIPQARLLLISGDHLSAVINPDFAAAIVEFLATA
jgi:pimeloyl-ACP methyl ester carboxylesterase